VLEVGGNALEPAYRDRFFLHPPTAASRFAGAIASAPEDPREHVGPPIDHIGVAVTSRGDQADIFGHRGVGRTRPLAVHDLVKVVRDRNVGGLHLFLLHAAFRSLVRSWVWRYARCCAAFLPWPSSARLRSPNPARILVERGADFHGLYLV